VIDNSSAWRMDPDVAADRARGQCQRGLRLRKKNINRQSELFDRAARVALKPLHDKAVIKRVVGLDLSIGVGRRQGCDG